MRYLLWTLLFLFIVSCNNKFQAERVDIDLSCHIILPIFQTTA